MQNEESALVFLQSARNGILMYSMALTETTNSSARTILTNHLKNGLTLHREISDLMLNKGWLPTYPVKAVSQPAVTPPKIHFS